MAEERMIDDEYGRGVRLRKTKDGFVDVTDELALATEEEEGEEISFAFPVLDGEADDEDLVGLTPEEAIALRKQKLEAAQRLRAEYEETVRAGNELLDTGAFRAAELKFEQALQLDGVATEASVGYWRAKTANFTSPDALAEEYVESSIESLEYDLGYEAVEVIKRDYRPQLEKRLQALKEEEEPLFLEVSQKQERRRVILKERKKKALIPFVCTGAALLVCLVLTVVFGLQNFSTPDATYIPVTIVFAVLSIGLFFAFAVCSNKLLNARRIYAANEKLTSTEEGEKLFHITELIDLYEALLEGSAEDGAEEEEISPEAVESWTEEK